MLDLPQYEYEHVLYQMVPPEQRWVFNKLMVAERLGIECGPCGDKIRVPGDYCIRPIMNLNGCGMGGWFKHTARPTDRGPMNPEPRPGYFWMPWYEGRHLWTEYEYDEPARQAGGFLQGNTLLWEQSYDFVPFPDAVRGLSRYMTVETIGDNVVEIAPKHMKDNENGLMDMRLVETGAGPMWEEIWESIRPWAD